MDDDLHRRFRAGLEEEVWHHSGLAKWMASHHDEAAALLNHGKLDWRHAAELFAGQGLLDQNEKPPTAKTARETWKRVEARRREGMKLRKGA